MNSLDLEWRQICKKRQHPILFRNDWRSALQRPGDGKIRVAPMQSGLVRRAVIVVQLVEDRCGRFQSEKSVTKPAWHIEQGRFLGGEDHGSVLPETARVFSAVHHDVEN